MSAPATCVHCGGQIIYQPASGKWRHTPDGVRFGAVRCAGTETSRSMTSHPTQTSAITVEVIGVPAPQGSKTAVVRGGHARLIEGGSTVGRRKHRAWREAVAWEARAAVMQCGQVIPDDRPVRVAVDFLMPKPKSRPKRAVWCDRKPDLDKLVRATLDGLADGGLLRHDSRVVQLQASKRYAADGEPTGATIDVEALP